MTWCRRRRAASVLWAAGLLAGAGLLGAAPAAWRLLLGGADVTRIADPMAAGDVLMVDAAALASSLGIVVRTGGREVAITDATGSVWQGEAGGSVLRGVRGEEPLARPLRLEGHSVYLPAAVLAELAGVVLRQDPERRVASLERVVRAELTAPQGWQTFRIPKPASPGAGGAAAPAASLPAVLPPDHDALRWNLAVGHVAGADWGGEISATGSWRGIETRLAGLLTRGIGGTGLETGYLALDRPGSWGLEAGDLFSEIWGLAQGVRWLGGETGRREVRGRPSFSLYLPRDAGGGRRETTAAAGWDVALGPSASLAGELSSDGSWLLRGRYRGQRAAFSLFGREASGSGPGLGLSGFFELPAGLLLQGGWSRGGEGDRELAWNDLALIVPLRAGARLTFETTAAESDRTRVAARAAAVETPLGPARLRLRWQQRQSLLRLGGERLTGGQEEVTAALSWVATSRLRLDAQAVHRSSGGRRTESWQQLGATWRLLPGTSLQVVAASPANPFDEPLRLRVGRELPDGFSLWAEYGHLAAFQEERDGGQEARWKFTLRKTWDMATPPGGGLVEGAVAGPLDAAPAGLPVQLGPYRTATDERGRFAFPNVPPGGYDLEIPRQAVPASFQAAPPRRLEVAARSRSTADLALVPLGRVAGAVFVDRNGNGRRDAGEGVATAVLWLDDRVTATGADGAFEFHQVSSGTHRLHVDENRLPPGLTVTVPSLMELGLPAGAVLDGVELRLAAKSKAVVFERVTR